MTLRSFLYALARRLGDLNAIRRGKLLRRVENKVHGRIIGSRIWRRR
jgi:hypothetical protein